MLSNQSLQRLQSEIDDLRRRSMSVQSKIGQLRQDELREQEALRKKFALEIQREEGVMQHLQHRITELEEDLAQHQEDIMKELHRTQQEVRRNNNSW